MVRLPRLPEWAGKCPCLICICRRLWMVDLAVAYSLDLFALGHNGVCFFKMPNASKRLEERKE